MYADLSREALLYELDDITDGINGWATSYREMNDDGETRDDLFARYVGWYVKCEGTGWSTEEMADAIIMATDIEKTDAHQLLNTIQRGLREIDDDGQVI